MVSYDIVPVVRIQKALFASIVFPVTGKVSPLNTAGNRPLSMHDVLRESVTHYPDKEMSLSHQLRPNQMRGRT